MICPEYIQNALRVNNALARSLLAEFYGTAVLRFIGTGVMAQFVLSHGTFNAPVQVNIGWGFAIMFAVYLAWKISGGHVNPAVTTALYICRKISLLHGIFYCIVQTLGAAFGAGLSYLVYYEALNSFDGGLRQITGPNATAVIFASFPAPYLSNLGGFIDQVAGTGIIGLFVAFFCEPKNEIPHYLLPTFFGCVATVVGMCYGLNMGSPVNPASDFGSRLFAALAGYGIEMFTFHNYFFLVPLFGPIVGAAVGAYSYLIFIGLHTSEQKAENIYKPDDKTLCK